MNNNDYKKVFTTKELSEYLKVTRQAISDYKKHSPKKFYLMTLGFAAKKLNIDYEDLRTLNKLKNNLKEKGKEGFRYFYTLNELADFLNVSIQAVRNVIKKKDSPAFKRRELIRIGFAIHKLGLNFDDLIKYANFKKTLK